MAEILAKGTMEMPPELVSELIDKVKGESVLQKLSKQEPIPFNGVTQFTFSFDKDVDIVAENGQKGVGGVTLSPINIVPIKFEYGARLSEEAWFSTEAARIDLVKSFSDGFSKKLAKGLDLAAIHGVNPRTRQASTIVGTNNFMNTDIAKVDASNLNNIDSTINSAIAVITGNEYENTGVALSTTAASAMGDIASTTGAKMYPEFMFGGYPASLAGKNLGVSTNVSAVKHGNATPHVIVGDFNMFKWGFARSVELRVIQYGDPDGQGDLARANQIYLRGEAYLGWAIMDNNAFAVATVTA